MSLFLHRHPLAAPCDADVAFFIEGGKFTPSTTLAIRLARYFNIPVEELFILEE